MKECILCKIAQGIEKSYIVYNNKYVLACAPTLNTIISKRHLILMPKKHFETIYDIPENDLFELIKAAKSIALKLKSKFNADGINILHASGAVAQQSVLHFHFHLIPRYQNDNLNTWPNTGYKELNYPNIYLEMKNIVCEDL